MDTVIQATWAELLGSRLTDPGTSGFLHSLHHPPKKLRIQDYGLRYLVYLLDGIEIVHTDGKISAIHIHVEPDLSSRAWVRILPYCLQRGMARNEARGLLGMPRESHRTPSGESIDEWLVGQCHLSLTFAPDSWLLSLITMSHVSNETSQLRRENSS